MNNDEYNIYIGTQPQGLTCCEPRPVDMLVDFQSLRQPECTRRIMTDCGVCGVSFVWRDSDIILSEGSRGLTARSSCFKQSLNPLNILLVDGLEHFLFFHILGIIIPTGFHIFQRD